MFYVVLSEQLGNTPTYGQGKREYHFPAWALGQVLFSRGFEIKSNYIVSHLDLGGCYRWFHCWRCRHLLSTIWSSFKNKDGSVLEFLGRHKIFQSWKELFRLQPKWPAFKRIHKHPGSRRSNGVLASNGTRIGPEPDIPAHQSWSSGNPVEAPPLEDRTKLWTLLDVSSPFYPVYLLHL